MKVKVMQRSVYHKYAEIEVDVPQDVDVQEWLVNNEDKWVDEIDEAISKAEYHFGNGMDTYDWTDDDMDSEFMYSCPDGYGGHI